MRWASNIGSISISLLVLFSLFVIVTSSTTYAEPEQAPFNTTLDSTGSDEVAAASGSNRFVLWVNDWGSDTVMFFRRSTDNGATWQPKVNMGSGFGPQIAVAGSNVYIVFGQNNLKINEVYIFFGRSTDNGATWEWEQVEYYESYDSRNWYPSPQIAVSGSNVYVGWFKNPEWSQLNNNDIFVRRSTDNGATWKPPVNVSNNPGNSFYPQIAASGSNVYVSWTQWNTDQTLSDVFFRRSTDNGATWKPAVNVSNNPGPSTGPQIAVSGSNVYVAWVDETAGNREILLRRSTDNGATWKFVKNLSNNLGDSYLGQIVVSGSNVYVVGQDETPGNWEIFFRRSTDNGATWKPAVNVSNNPGPSTGPQITASGSNVYVVWDQKNLSETLSDVFFKRSTDNGATWKPFKNLSSNGHSLGPDLAVSGANVFVVWTNNAVGNGDIFFQRSTDNGATWKPVKNLSSNDSGSYGPQIRV
jgi:BNR repeat protein